MRSRPTTAGLRLATAVVALAVAIAGCGGGSTPPPSRRARRRRSRRQIEQSALRSRFDDLVAGLLERRGLDAAVTECALGELDDSVGDAELKAAADQIRKTATVPPEIIDAAAAAGEACSGD